MPAKHYLGRVKAMDKEKRNRININKQRNMKRIECIIMDWVAPVAAFMESFKAIGIEVTAAETRAFMGLTKIEGLLILSRCMARSSSLMP